MIPFPWIHLSCACKYEIYSEIINTEAIFTKKEWTMNETLIFFKIVPLSFITYSCKFSISQSISETLLIQCEAVLCFFFFLNILHVLHIRIFSLENKKKFVRSRSGEFGEYCTCTIQCFTIKRLIKKNWELVMTSFFQTD